MMRESRDHWEHKDHEKPSPPQPLSGQSSSQNLGQGPQPSPTLLFVLRASRDHPVLRIPLHVRLFRVSEQMLFKQF